MTSGKFSKIDLVIISLKLADFITESSFVLSGSIIFESKKTSSLIYVLINAFFPSIIIDVKMIIRNEIAQMIPINQNSLKFFSDLCLLISESLIFSKFLVILFSIFFNYF